MKIYSMTATFGKLEHEQLTLKPGLNVLHAPNEWGKSTWCAFLCAMLYGLDTRVKTTKTALADKERFAPWSGSPMEGRMNLNWQGRDITIERQTKGRIPLGEFRAYETATGIDIPELTAANCGQMLLGVEQSVFRRAGFIRLTDLPVTQDDALRSRLNALVTTGDESGDAVRLEQSLRELKNRCRYNRSGLLPQAIARQELLEDGLREAIELETQFDHLTKQLDENNAWLTELENHRNAMDYAIFQQNMQRVQEAREVCQMAEDALHQQEQACDGLPSRATAEEKSRSIRELARQWTDMQNAYVELPPEPQKPEVHKAFRDMSPDKAVAMVAADEAEFNLYCSKKWLLLMIPGLLALFGTGALFSMKLYPPAILCLVAGVAALVLSVLHCGKGYRLEKVFLDKYGTLDVTRWRPMALSYSGVQRNYEKALEQHRTQRAKLDELLETLRKKKTVLCAEQEPEHTLETWQRVIDHWTALDAARQDAASAEKYLNNLAAMAKDCPPPTFPDSLELTAEETHESILRARQEQQHLSARREQCRSRMESHGTSTQLNQQLQQANQRVQQLEDTYAALTIALETLSKASSELQRRFAPRISGRAQELLQAMTRGRYDRLVIGEDFSLRAGAAMEDTLHDALWRSDGTIDQLYLALRLAVSEELTPEAPLILDDALVRFDEDRLEAAMDILTAMAADKQILLFTCQRREQTALAKKETPT